MGFFFSYFFGISMSKVTVSPFWTAAWSFQPEIIAWSDDKLASKRRDSPGMSFYYLKGFSYSRTDQNNIIHDLKL